MQSIEGPYAHSIAAEKNRYIVASAEVFPSTSQLEEQFLDYHRAMMTAIAYKYQGLAIRIGLKETFDTMKGLKQRYDWEKLWLYLARKWMVEYGTQAAKETADTTRDDMQKIINTSLSQEEEFNPVQVAANLLKARDLSAFRAETIALTEVHNAMMYANVEGAAKVSSDNGITLTKKWVPVLDERTRVNHASMSGVPPIPMEQDFTVGGVRMSRPGDPKGGAANIIRCRCTIADQVVDE